MIRRWSSQCRWREPLAVISPQQRGQSSRRQLQQVSGSSSCGLVERLLTVASPLVLTVGLQPCQGISKSFTEEDCGRRFRGVIEAHQTRILDARSVDLMIIHSLSVSDHLSR